MRKYLSGTLAITLAIGFSTYSLKDKAKNKNGPFFLYWYATENGITVSEILYSGDFGYPLCREELSELIGVPCEGGNSVLCVRGSDSQRLVASPLPATADPDYSDFRKY
jgi:hypothetical protein